MQALAATGGSCVARSGDSAIVYFADEGSWRILPPGVPGMAGYYPSAPEYNSWQTWDMRVYPRTGGVFRQYDSAETVVIDEHLQMIHDAGIDFLIIDVTNDVARDWLTRRALAVIARIRQWNRSHSDPLYYAIAIGPTVLPRTLEDLENQARLVWQRLYVDSTSGLDGASYLHLNDPTDGLNKPLLVVEDGIRQQHSTDLIRRGEWAGRFTIKWWGAVREQSVAPAEWGDYYGWVFYDGALPNADAMHVQPGHVNATGRICRFYPSDSTSCPLSRVPAPVSENTLAGAWYTEFNWERVLAADPAMVIINSFNEYGEETALAPADTGRSLGEKWYNPQGRLDPDYYWSFQTSFSVV
jgi:hypothetical protein